MFAIMVSSCTRADSFIVKIVCTDGERSKDSWAYTEYINISGNNVSYSKKHTGHMHGEPQDIEKSCTFTDEQIARIQKVINEKNLMTTDSLFDQSTKYKSFENFENLTIDIAWDEKISKIRMNGDLLELKDHDLYKNSHKLLELAISYVDKCK